MEFYCIFFFPNFGILPIFKSQVDLRVYRDYGNGSKLVYDVLARFIMYVHDMNTICMYLHSYIELHSQT